MFRIAEVLLHFPRRAEGNHHVTGSRAHRRKCMRHTTRIQDGFAGAQLNPLLTYLEDHFPLHDVEPFLLVEMQVEGRPTRKEMRVLYDEEACGSLAGRHLE